MTVATISNDISADLDKCITWQFDKSTNVVALINALKAFANYAVTIPCDLLQQYIYLLATSTKLDFGLALWAKLLGVERPQLTYGSTTATMTTAKFKTFITGLAKLLFNDSSIEEISAFISASFPNAQITAKDNGDCAVTFVDGNGTTDNETEDYAAFNALKDSIRYPTGFKSNEQDLGPVFAFREQVKPTATSKLSEQTVGTSVTLLIKGTVGTTIPTDASFTYGGKIFTNIKAVTIPSSGEVCATFATSGAAYVPQESISSLTTTISGISSITNRYRSMTDFKIGGLDDGVIAWDRPFNKG